MSRRLIVIDDRYIKRKAFSEAEKVLKKLERLEKDIATFYETDQRLFQNWYELTFREEHRKIEDLQAQYQQSCRVRDWILAIARQKSLSLPEAYAVYREEEEAYRTGSHEDRLRIEKEREERDKYILSELDDQEEYSPPSRTPEEDARFREISEASDTQLRKVLKNRKEGLDLLIEISGLMRSERDYEVFLRVWALTPQKLQNEFKDIFEELNGTSLDDVLAFMEMDLVTLEALEDENDSGFEGEVLRDGDEQGRVKSENSEEAEKIKLVYRRLVRKLHPDRQETDVGELWLKALWQRMQDAYRMGDLTWLEGLEIFFKIKARDIDGLSLSEIQLGQKWLEAEILWRNLEVSELKCDPAWGFSRKKSLKALQKRLARDFEAEYAELSAQVKELSDEIECLRIIVDERERRKSARRGRKSQSERRASRPSRRSTL